LKILFVLPAYAPCWSYGGVVRCMANMCIALTKHGADLSVYSTIVDGMGALLPVEPGREIIVDNVKTTYFAASGVGGFMWRSRTLCNALTSCARNYDIIYVSANYQLLGLSVCRIARKYGIPYILGAHGSFHIATLAKGKLKKSLFYHLFLKHCIDRASAVHFTTEYERRMSTSFVRNVSSFIVPNTVPLRDMDERLHTIDIRKFHGIDKGAPILLTVTRPDPVKRLDVLIAAFKKVIQAIPGVTMIIVCPLDNAYTGSMRRLAADCGISRKLIWAGYQSGDILNAYYRQSDIFLLTSEHENFSMATVEAMAEGTPVIITNGVGVADEIERHGTGVVTELDPDSIALAVISLISNPDRIRMMREKCRSTVGYLFSGRRIARLMLQAFGDVLIGQKSAECTWE
jgi:glycosyltransferase involved in cell wall biosynthesis